MSRVFKIMKGESVQLYETSTVKFIAHSHKKARIDGQPSPLIMYLEYYVRGEAKKIEYHFETNYEKIKKDKPTWNWKGLVFKLLNYEY